MLPRTLCLSVLHSNCVFCQCPRGIVTVLPRALCLSVLHSHCFFSASAWLCDSVTQDTVFRCYTQIVFFCQRPRCTVTVLPRAFCLSVSPSNCVFCQCPQVIVTGVTQDTLSCGVTLNFFCQCPPCIVTVSTQDTLSFGVTLKLCFFVSVRVAS